MGRRLHVALTNPQGVVLGNPSAPARLCDNDLAVVDLLAEWKTLEGNWEVVPSDEVLWADEEHRWLSSFDPPPNVLIDNIQWFVRPWAEWESDPHYDLENFLAEWGMFTSAGGLDPAGGGMLGELPPGLWAVTAKVNFLERVPACGRTAERTSRVHCRDPLGSRHPWSTVRR